MLGQDSWERTAGKGQLGPDSWDKKAVRGHPEKRIWESTGRTRIRGQDGQNMTTRTGQPGKENRRRQPRQDSHNISVGTGHLAHDNGVTTWQDNPERSF